MYHRRSAGFASTTRMVATICLYFRIEKLYSSELTVVQRADGVATGELLLLRKGELLQQFPAVWGLLYCPLKTSNGERSPPIRPKRRIFDLGGSIFRQVNNFDVGKPILEFIRIAVIAQFLGNPAQIVVHLFQCIALLCQQPKPTLLVVDIHPDDISDFDVKGAELQTVFFQPFV